MSDELFYNYVIDKEETQEFIRRMIPMLDYLFKNFELEGRMHLVVGDWLYWRATSLSHFNKLFCRSLFKILSSSSFTSGC